ncbi:MAG: NADH-dependent flavin oxidoreductase [Methanobrevibacter sp.]|uniref:oxidoreductase n=1 Tax=Methanobrevibacter sp. TaxID=66852 RepID=UPI0025FCDA62|nr:NADH-dependent flavin oxidoreductase [Methanobrevibacter sp.]MBE6498548.1 NADH-dependent flavin oxidoreductase [Methanobrevibacter sp.]
MKDLFDNVDFGEFKLNSRIVRTGLWESEREQQGNLTPEIYNRYENIAASGVGLIITELYSLYPRDVFSKYSQTMNYTRFVREAKDLTDMVHVYDVPIFAQVGFVQFNKKAQQNMSVEDISIDDIRKIQTDYIIAAQKLDYAGFDGIQIALGNYYFLSRFINPYFNKRTDKYGGNTLNRLRIVLEMIKVIKQNTGLHINCRLNAFDIQKGGMTLDETIEIAKLLEKHGADSLQITRPRSPQYFSSENYEKKLLAMDSSRIIDNVDIPVIMGGGVKTQRQINNILNKTKVDFISMQRPFVADPSFLVDWQIEGDGEVKCRTCNNCYWKKTATCFIYRTPKLNVK